MTHDSLIQIQMLISTEPNSCKIKMREVTILSALYEGDEATLWFLTVADFLLYTPLVSTSSFFSKVSFRAIFVIPLHGICFCFGFFKAFYTQFYFAILAFYVYSFCYSHSKHAER